MPLPKAEWEKVLGRPITDADHAKLSAGGAQDRVAGVGGGALPAAPRPVVVADPNTTSTAQGMTNKPVQEFNPVTKPAGLAMQAGKVAYEGVAGPGNEPPKWFPTSQTTTGDTMQPVVPEESEDDYDAMIAHARGKWGL
jgi:hypothetical protein